MFAINARMQTLLPTASEADLTGSSKLLVPGKVISSTRIPQGTLSMPINPEDLRGVTEVVQISVGTDVFGTLALEPNSKDIWNTKVHWTRALRLADDCHSYNIQLRKDSQQIIDKTGEKTQGLVLQAVRPVEPGQELLLWFSEEILATLHMGFLTPANIQGQKNYVCTKCSALYESPNPLKLHLTLGCGKQTMPWLWEQLSQRITSTTSSPSFHFKLMTESYVPKQKIAIDLSSTYNAIKNAQDQQNILSSAFRPFRKSLCRPSAATLQNNNVYSPSPFSHWPRLSIPGLPADYAHSVHTPYHAPTHTALPMPRSCQDDAQIETLVSSLGKYKEGHICLYCGKSYSRKYGLKIHIRTHTGYKPLKCKYCLRPFGDPSNLNKHVRLHAEGETPYKCEICGKVLVRRRDLERHMKARHSEDLATATFLSEETEDDGNFINSSNSSEDEISITEEENAREESIDIEDTDSNTNE